MAHSDDIAEKVADALLDPLSKTAGSVIDVGGFVLSGAGKLAEQGIDNLIKKINDAKGTRDADKLLEVIGEISPMQMTELTKRTGLRTHTFLVADSDLKDFEELLRESGVAYAKMDVKNDNAKMVIFLERDRDRIVDVMTALNAKRGLVTEVRPDLYINSLAPENIRVVDGLDRVELELFRHYARKEGLLFTALQRGKDYAVIFEAKEADKGRTALLHVGWDLTGYNGARNREQVEYRLKGRNAIQISAEEGQRELYIVSKTRPQDFVHISETDLAVYKAGKQVSTTPRSTPDFYTRCIAAAEGLDSGVVVTPEQYRPDMTQDELASHPTIDLFTRDYDDFIEISRQSELISLISMKSSMDDEHSDTWGLWDPSVSYSEFSGYEYIADEEEREARELEFEHFKQAAYYAQDRYAAQDVHLDERNINYIIQKADEKRRAQARGMETRQRQSDKSEDFDAPAF